MFERGWYLVTCLIYNIMSINLQNLIFYPKISGNVTVAFRHGCRYDLNYCQVPVPAPTDLNKPGSVLETIRFFFNPVKKSVLRRTFFTRPFVLKETKCRLAERKINLSRDFIRSAAWFVIAMLQVRYSSWGRFSYEKKPLWFRSARSLYFSLKTVRYSSSPFEI